jgi:hypothetical protein
MVSRNIVSRIRPLRKAGRGHGTNGQSKNPATLHPANLHQTLLAHILSLATMNQVATGSAEALLHRFWRKKKAARTV